MSKGVLYTVLGLVISVISVITFFNTKKKPTDFSEVVRLSLRDAGNQLLLANQDSTSLVLPITVLEPNKYQLSFQETLKINPDSLLSTIKRSFKKSNLATSYRVEVLECARKEVAYSYEIIGLGANDIVPCKGRILPKSCYAIEVRFTDKAAIVSEGKMWCFITACLGLIIAFIGVKLIIKKPEITELTEIFISDATKLGSFLFYPEQNKLVKEAEEISLSAKECELLSIFIEKPNEIIKREELSKKVWEDKGVVVGRSLDTYISKLRKKLKTDSTIKLTNIHGVGYKLEV